MKRVVIGVIALLLLLAAIPALAGVGDDMYATKDGVNVYLEPNTDSEVVLTLNKGDMVHVMEESEDGGWYGFYPPDDSMGLSWVQKDNLNTEAPHEHEWGDWEITKQPTCTEDGARVRYCAICGKGQEESIDKLGHDYGDWTVTREATCTRAGERTRTCKVCGHVQTKEIEPLPHEYGEWTVTLEATDHSAGRRTRTCAVCGQQESQDFDPEGTLRRGDKGDGVRAIQQLLIDQGYLEDGEADGSFGGATENAIKKFQLDQGLNPDGVAWPQTQQRLEHHFGPWTVTVVPLSRDTDGVHTRTCQDCGYQQSETIPASPAFAKGDQGEAVRTIQSMLNDLGCDAGSADGIYGRKLDAAFTALAQTAGFEFVEGNVLPSEVDSLVNRWIAARPQESWKGEGDKDSPVELALTVTPRDETESIIRTFDWTLSNLGSEPCSFKALLLGFGEDHSFQLDNFAVVLDSADLEGTGSNSLTGTFMVSDAWDLLETGVINFSALAVADDGGVWLSNAVVIPADASPAEDVPAGDIPVGE